MERRDLYEDDLTEERYPSPAKRDEVAASEELDPDEPDDGDTAPPQRSSRPGDVPGTSGTA